ncbi:NADPH--cytochrome P450 reductase [Hondaea fermentalgiana]|uniref:NADPH--cytochrome P450 reductase n=1 Tax=Hondaea fermentalgiana TaxID=2315210 RepID=A0A2R5GM25_9STRA|nr:NADPH--cytochrome P450 reductase [Hondaea fermentalgiana]|eukprot:GBG31675.1 NADPH--cytochrome P450 reductase [Hondaea fermentalgiana]
MIVLYGSQTGSAEEVAERIAREASRRNFGPEVPCKALDAYKREDLVAEKLVIFVVATTGDGDPPDNMRQFWRFLLRKGLPSDVLAQLQFVVFGCGDSSYAKYNVMARMLRNRLLQLGAKEIADRGFADDQSQHGLEGDLDAWLPLMWTQVLQHYPLPPDFVIDDAPRLFAPRNEKIRTVEARTTSENGRPDEKGDDANVDATWSAWATSAASRAPFGTYSAKPFEASLVCNDRITAADWEQDVRHIELAFEEELPYEAGDIAVVYPENEVDEVRLARLLQKMDLPRLDTILELDVAHVPRHVSMRHLLRRYLDVLGTPRRRFFEALMFFAGDEEEKEKCEELSSREGNDLFHAYCKKERKSYLEVLEEFASVKVPLEYLVDMIPLLQPREYSISSAPRAHGRKRLQLTVAMLAFVTPWGRNVQGVASRWWAGMAPQHRLLCQIKKGTLRLPEAPETPLILVGPGTGVAPMRALIHERQQENVHLYFGCRSKTKDDYYRDEWNAMLEAKKLGSVRTAYSRDDPRRKVYVQRLVRDDGAKIADLLLQQEGVLYISGSAKQMPTDVKEAVQDAIAASLGQEGLDADAAKVQASRVVQVLQRKNRFKIEAWS